MIAGPKLFIELIEPNGTRRSCIAITQRMPSIWCVNAFAENLLQQMLQGKCCRTFADAHRNRHILFVSKLFLSGLSMDFFSPSLWGQCVALCILDPILSICPHIYTYIHCVRISLWLSHQPAMQCVSSATTKTTTTMETHCWSTQ